GMAIVQDQFDGMNTAPQGFRDKGLEQKGLEVNEALPVNGVGILLSFGDAQSGKKLQSTLSLIAWRNMRRMTRARRLRGLFQLARLDGGLFSDTHRLDALPE
ncbi:MAG TPA: hypothetical protein VLH85_06125, partial [Levilinea sp.]|nr:hypothetical protein [Levilinea sp.]